MAPFNENGFWGKHISIHVDKTRKKYYDWILLLSTINKFCQKTQYKIEVEDYNIQHLVVATLYSRTLSTFQAVLILAEKGMVSQSKMLQRCMLESLFTLAASTKSKQFVTDYVLTDHLDTIKFYNKAIALKNEAINKNLEKKENKEFINDIQKQIKDSKIRKINVEETSKKAGLHKLYLSAYSILSITIHTSPRELQKHLILDGDENVVSLKNEPSDLDLNTIYITAAEGMLTALAAVDKIFNLGTSDFIQGHLPRIKKLSEKHND